MPPGARGSPGRVSSSPVATTATRGLRVTSTSARSPAASTATSRGVMRRPRSMSRSPARKSRPRRRTFSPGCGACVMRTLSPSGTASSWITTASAPSGTTPPVKIRTAWPATTRPSKGCPAGASPITASSAARVCIGDAHGIAVHRRHRRRRMIERGHRIARKDAARGLGERDGLGGQRRESARARVARPRRRKSSACYHRREPRPNMASTLVRAALARRSAESCESLLERPERKP